MAIGILLGNFVPSTGPALQRGQFVGVSVPIAVGLLVMMYPILCKVRFETLHLLFRKKDLWKQIAISFVLNWIVAPLFMTALAWAFLPDRRELRDGLIFVGVARCIAMVLIWTDLAGGDGDYCAVLVAFNSILQIVLFAPLAVFYVQVVSGDPAPHSNGGLYSTCATSVAVFLGIPLAAAIITRLVLRWLLGEHNYQHKFIRFIAPFWLRSTVSCRSCCSHPWLCSMFKSCRTIRHPITTATSTPSPRLLWQFSWVYRSERRSSRDWCCGGCWESTITSTSSSASLHRSR